MIALAALGPACSTAEVFGCVQASQCVQGSQVGTCESTGYCSFPDSTCESGQRYGDLAAGELAGACVDPTAGTGHDGDDDDGATGQGSSSSSADTGGITTSAIDDTGESTRGPSMDTSGDTSEGTTTTSTGTDDSGSSSSESTGTGAEPVTLCFGENADADVSGVTFDTFIAEDNPTLNHGSHADVHVHSGGGDSVALLAFDLTQVPGGAQVVGVTLELWTETEGVLTGGTCTVHAMLESWEAGVENGAVGVCNWTERISGELWTTPGAGPGSHDPTVLASFVADQPDAQTLIDLPPELVQGWVDDPDANHGVQLRTEATTVFGWLVSSDFSDDTRRPELCVTFVRS